MLHISDIMSGEEGEREENKEKCDAEKEEMWENESPSTIKQSRL